MEYVHSITNYLGLTHDESQAQSHPEDSENSQKAKDAACAPAADEDDDDIEGWKLRGGPTRNAVSGTRTGGRPKCPDYNRGKCAPRCPKGYDHLCSRCSGGHPAVTCKR